MSGLGEVVRWKLEKLGVVAVLGIEGKSWCYIL